LWYATILDSVERAIVLTIKAMIHSSKSICHYSWNYTYRRSERESYDQAEKYNLRRSLGISEASHELTLFIVASLRINR